MHQKAHLRFLSLEKEKHRKKTPKKNFRSLSSDCRHCSKTTLASIIKTKNQQKKKSLYNLPSNSASTYKNLHFNRHWNSRKTKTEHSALYLCIKSTFVNSFIGKILTLKFSVTGDNAAKRTLRGIMTKESKNKQKTLYNTSIKLNSNIGQKRKSEPSACNHCIKKHISHHFL